MATAPSPTYRVAAGASVNAGRFPGGRATGAFTLGDAELSGDFASDNGLPAYLSGKAVLEWGSLSNINSAGIVPSGYGSTSAIIDAWGGGTVRQLGPDFIIHGGGHGDRSGNEIYSLDLSADAPVWIRKWGPSAIGDVTGTPYYADGNPASAHTYYYMQFDEAADKLLRVKGGPGYPLAGTTYKFDSYAWGAANWDPAGTNPDVPAGAGGSGPGTCRDPVTGDIFVWDGFYRARFSKASGTWVLSGNTAAGVSRIENAMVVDTTRNCVWSFGTYDGSSGARVERWEISDNSTSYVTATGTHEFGGQRGAAYDPENDCVWYIANDGILRKFDPATYACTTASTTGTGPSSNATYGSAKGYFGRFVYVSALKMLVMQGAWASPTFFIRTS